MEKEKNQVSFDDLFGKMQENNAVENVNQNWFNEMQEQAISKIDKDLLIQLSAIFNKKMRYAEHSFLVFSSMFCFSYLILFMIYQNFISNFNVDIAVLTMIASLFMTIILEIVRIKIRKKAAIIKYRKRILDFAEISKEKGGLKGGKIYVANYIIANLNIQDPHLKKDAIKFILKRCENKVVEISDIEGVIKNLEMERIIVFNDYDFSKIIEKDISISMNKLDYTGV